MPKYTEVTNLEGLEFIVRDNEDGTESWIPKNPINSDYQAYLKWVADGGTLVANGDTPTGGN